MRQVVLDTETTGLEPSQGHRIIEIGGIEMIDRRHTGRHFHVYLQPDRAIDAGAQQVHGITAEFLRDKPRFKDIVEELNEFLFGAELVIHNAPFDVGFLDNELRLLRGEPLTVAQMCPVLDTLALARQMHPGQRNSLDALCKRYSVDNSQRELHGALLDARILADVYLAMTGGQATLELDEASTQALGEGAGAEQGGVRGAPRSEPLRVIPAAAGELASHEALMTRIEKAAGRRPRWPGDDPAPG